MVELLRVKKYLPPGCMEVCKKGTYEDRWGSVYFSGLLEQKRKLCNRNAHLDLPGILLRQVLEARCQQAFAALLYDMVRGDAAVDKVHKILHA
eukprot:1161983-Pelagomonas_calceolata.AAC.3